MLKARPQRVCGCQRCEFEGVVGGGPFGAGKAVITPGKTLTDANFIFGDCFKLANLSPVSVCELSAARSMRGGWGVGGAPGEGKTMCLTCASTPCRSRRLADPLYKEVAPRTLHLFRSPHVGGGAVRWVMACLLPPPASPSRHPSLRCL